MIRPLHRSVQRAFLFLPQEKEQNMKKKYAGAILILLLLITVSIGVLRLWVEQPEVRFSEKDAFQTEAFDLKLSTRIPGTKIYYTLNGDEPTLVMPCCLFTADAARSPIWEAAAPTAQIRAKAAIYLPSNAPYAAPSNAAPTTPPMAPSMDFFGLNTGASLCFPISTPVQYAQVSQPHALKKISQTS